jgi:DNA-binding transcriptional MerR regulator
VLSIGELAARAGTTVRTVRHYHAVGLLPEPERDRSGYRRYGAAALVRLLRVRRLRELGLPLGRIAELLAAPGPDLHRALDALDAELAAQAERIAAQRAQLADLRAHPGDPELPPPLDAVFARAAAEGAPARALEQDKELLLLDLALHPERADEIVAEYAELYARLRADADHAALAAAVDALADLPADSPEVEEVARRMAVLIRRQRARVAPRDVGRVPEQLFRDWSTTLPPAQQRLMERLQELVPELTVI